MSQQAPPPAIDQKDIDHWTNRFNEALAKPEIVTGPAAQNAQEWQEGFFNCFNPIDTCLITCCVPCVTFGKTHHRTHKNGNMEGYSAVNTSCLMFWGFSCFGLHCIPTLMQRVAIRQKYNLQGDFVTDFLTSWCCACCSVIQQEKESELREKENLNKTGYVKNEGMAYPA